MNRLRRVMFACGRWLCQRAEAGEWVRGGGDGKIGVKGVNGISGAEGVLRVRDEAMMGRALELARWAGARGEVPVGAVVYELSSGAIVGEGYNRREMDKDPAGHAEVMAIREAARALGDWRLSGCGLAVTLEPCAMCAGLIVQSRLGRLTFGAFDPKAGFCGSLGRLTEDARLNHRVAAIGGVLGAACGAELKAFFAERRRTGRGDKPGEEPGSEGDSKGPAGRPTEEQ